MKSILAKLIVGGMALGLMLVTQMGAEPCGALAPPPRQPVPLAQSPVMPIHHATGGSALSPIDLSSALRLAARDNPTIALARERIAENLALQQAADVLLEPTLTAGSNFRLHRGVLQNPDGQIFAVNSQSLYLGGGAEAVGAQTVAVPAIRIFAPLGDAWLEPLLARQRVTVATASASGTFNAVLLDVTGRFLDLAGARARYEALQKSSADIEQVVRTTADFARAGQGRKADADRAYVRSLLLRNDMSRTDERIEVASARLAAILHLDPAIHLRAAAVPVEPVQLVEPSYHLGELISIAVRARPELAARAAAVEAAETRRRQEVVRPLLPTVSAGFSGGFFGGGSDLSPPNFDHFNGRNDFDVLAFWTLENLGAGNVANTRKRRAEVGQAISQRARMVDQIGQEVADAHAAVTSRRQQIEITRRQLAIATQGFGEELLRIRGGEGLPIEVLNSFELLSQARLDAIDAVIEYDQAEFRLFVALGEPPTVALSGEKAGGYCR